VVDRVLGGQMAQAEAAVALYLSVRQVKRLVRRVRSEGGCGADLAAPGLAQQPAHR